MLIFNQSKTEHLLKVHHRNPRLTTYRSPLSHGDGMERRSTRIQHWVLTMPIAESHGLVHFHS